MCLLKIEIKVDASLKWVPQQAKLKSGTYIIKKKTVRAYTTYTPFFKDGEVLRCNFVLQG